MDHLVEHALGEPLVAIGSASGPPALRITLLVVLGLVIVFGVLMMIFRRGR